MSRRAEDKAGGVRAALASGANYASSRFRQSTDQHDRAVSQSHHRSATVRPDAPRLLAG